jgi:hypothetical protein
VTPQFPRKGIPAADLTKAEKLYLYMAAGAPAEIVRNGGIITARVTVPCEVEIGRGGGFIVTVGTKPSAP